MNQKYLIRLDDACPTMDKDKWDRMEQLLDKYGIKPLIGVVPDNHDENLQCGDFDDKFWQKVYIWKKKDYSIALHGYDHCYISPKAGLNPMWKRSEFAGVLLELQKDKIKKGLAILHSYGIYPSVFFAPSHTFDDNTLLALQEESRIRIISDTVSRFPYFYKGFFFIPQFIGHCVKMPLNGIYTFCFHPNTMNDESFNSLESFLTIHKGRFIKIEDIEPEKYGKKRFFDNVLSWLYFYYRHLKGLS